MEAAGRYISDEALSDLIEDAVRRGAERALRSAQKMKPLMRESEVVATLNVGRTTFRQKIEPKLPPLLIEGQRRWHPDSVDAYLRKIAAKRR